MLSPQTKGLRVLLLDPIPLEAKVIFQENSYEIDESFEPMSEGALSKKLSDYHIVCIGQDREEEYLTDEVLKSAHRLLCIGNTNRTGATTQIDLQAAQTGGIPVFVAPYQHQKSMAEYIISAIVLLSRQLLDRSSEVHQQVWNKVSADCFEVRGKTLGIIGYGHVGSQVGVMAEALSLRVIFYDADAVMPIGSAKPVPTIKDLLENSNYVVLGVSEGPHNVKMIGKEQLAWMKKGSYLINTSYGEAVDVEALADGLKSGHLGGAALDSFPSQPKNAKAAFKNPFDGLKNVILTPSIGDSTVEAKLRIGIEVANSIVRYIKDGSTFGSVNFPSVIAWPIKSGQRRILNMHRNVRGVLREIDGILSSYNVQKQVLDTQNGLGYLIADVATENVATEIVANLAMLSSTIRIRIL
ncbi:phosphoglycerate dehydrogenase [Synchytrium microbalum]|uniref:Phosphoglycerate dehydrogenase n=1 Tax=Synchytrium microbalum TaxID=1806994 RepID=A0A507CBC5_9FUNG|nr:phosphoglycerate dehydrogenase [Synchytrium microbalum]TPX35254.1 phosphoglycerate dehydrogenase [Synchytrium microbalum]